MTTKTKTRLKNTDSGLIAKQLGCNPVYVRMVIKGERNGNTPKAKMILKAHEILEKAAAEAELNKTQLLSTVNIDNDIDAE